MDEHTEAIIIYQSLYLTHKDVKAISFIVVTNSTCTLDLSGKNHLVKYSCNLGKNEYRYCRLIF